MGWRPRTRLGLAPDSYEYMAGLTENAGPHGADPSSIGRSSRMSSGWVSNAREASRSPSSCRATSGPARGRVRRRDHHR